MDEGNDSALEAPFDDEVESKRNRSRTRDKEKRQQPAKKEGKKRVIEENDDTYCEAPSPAYSVQKKKAKK